MYCCMPRRGSYYPDMTGQAPAIGVVLGHYRIVEQIGQGGMGVVFRARDEQLDRDVALKVLPPGTFPDETARRRFRREARALARLNHPNVAMAFDFGQQDGIDYLVTEFVSGANLEDRLAGEALPQRTIIDLGIQLAKGLAAAHREGIVHRDLKPANLRLTPDGQLKILDFGLAQWQPPVKDSAVTASIDGKGRVAGTLPYMSPEQVRCEEGDARVDIWGAGCVLYEISTKKRAFAAQEPLKLIETIQHADPPAPSTVNPHVTRELDTIILKALDKDPERRYQSARELGVDLMRMLPNADTRFTTTTFAHVERRPVWPKWVAAIVLVAALCLAVGYRLRRANSVSERRLLTVLPFDSAGQDDNTAALVRGMTETVTANLAQAWGPNLQLVSARDVREQNVKTADDAWKMFGADLVLEGDAHRVGDQIRINCSLVDAKTHRQLTARTITAEISDVFGLEDRVASEIAALVAEKTRVRPAAVVTGRNEVKPEAYASYLRARGYLREYQKAENIDLAIGELKHAVEVDSKYASAYALLGEAYLTGYQQVNRGADWVQQAQQYCERSQALLETAEGHICLGGVYNQTGKSNLAVPEFQRAVQIDASNEDGLRGLADAYMKLGDAPGAEATYKKAIAVRPDYWGGYSWLGVFYFNQSRYGDAVTQFQKVVELAPNNYRGYSNLGAMYSQEGKYEESLQPLNKSIEIRPNLEAFNNLGNSYFNLRRFSDAADAFQQGLNLDDSDWLLWGNLGDSLYWSGTRREQARSAYANAISRAEKRREVNPKDAELLAYLADYYAMTRQNERALNEIEQAMALAPNDGEVRFRAAIVYNQLGQEDFCLSALERALSLGYSPQVIRATPDFDHLRGNSKFMKLLAERNS